MRILVGVVMLVALTSAPAAGTVVQGTPTRDHLVGTSDDDVVLLRAGPDWGEGKGGADRIFGGPGRDGILGGGGPDHLAGGPGSDEIWPDDGADFVRADAGGDYVDVAPDGARDRIWCGRGHDVVVLMPELDPLDEFLSCEEFWQFTVGP